MQLRPTRRVPGLLVAGAVVYLFAVNSEVVWLYLVCGLLLALVPIGVVAPWVVTGRISFNVVSCETPGFLSPLARDRRRVFTGTLAIRVTVSGRLDAVEVTGCRLVDGSTVAARLVDPSDTGGLATIETSDVGRGLLAIAAVKIESLWPLGLVRVRRDVPCPFAVVVHPRYWVASRATTRGVEHGDLESRRRGPGEDFAGLREYRHGDPQRLVHWPTSARMANLMVVETAVEPEPVALYELEFAPGATATSTSLASSVVLSLVAASAADGGAVRLRLPEGRVVRSWPDALTEVALAGAGSRQGARIAHTPERARRVTATSSSVLVSHGVDETRIAATETLAEARRLLEVGG